MRILIVDDEPAVRSSLSRALRKKGYRIGTAADGGEALERARGAAYDAVILDVMMPVSTGSRCAAGFGTRVTPPRS
jgi:two-component system response regulator MprA